MSREVLQGGHDWVLARFYSLRNVLARLRKESASLPLFTALVAPARLHHGYRRRLRTDGTWRARPAPEDHPDCSAKVRAPHLEIRPGESCVQP